MSEKETLRKTLSQKRRSLPDGERSIYEKAATAFCLNELSGNVMVYISMGSEVSTRGIISGLLDKGVDVYAPYTIERKIVPIKIGAYCVPDKLGNMPEQCYDRGSFEAAKRDAETYVEEISTKIDCCVVPLIGFNKDGYRIGYGKGCYDEFLPKLEAKRVGLAFSFQQCDFTPDSHDEPLDCCVTEKSVIYFSHARDFRKV